MKDNLRMPVRSQAMTGRYPLFSSIRGRLYLLLLSVLIPLVLIQGGYLYVRFNARVENESQANLEMARAAAGTFSGFVRDILRQELAIGTNFTMSHPPSAAEMNQILETDRAEYPSIRNFSWLDPDGHIIASSMGPDIGLDVSDRDYVQKILSGREWVVSDLIQSRSTGKPIFTVSRAIRDSGRNLLGIVVAGIDPEKLGEVFSLDLAKDGAITILDSRGMAVYQHPRRAWGWEERNLLPARPAIKQALEGREVTGTFPCYTTGEKRVAALSPISSIGWAAGVGRSKEAVMAPVISQMLQQVGLFGLLMVAVFAYVFILSERITRPIRGLWEHALALGRGDPEKPIEITGSAELKDLAFAFNVMTEKVRAREEAIQESEEKFRSLAESSADCIIRYDREGRHLYVNPACVRVSGIPAEAFTGKTHRELGFDPKLCKEWEERIRKVFDTAEPEQWEFEFSGAEGPIHLDWRVVPEFNDGRVVAVLGVSRDITEQKRAEEELRSLPTRLLAAQEEERKRIANELHDSIGGALGAIKMGLQNSLHAAQVGTKPSETVEHLLSMVEHTIGEARRIYMNLRPSILDDLGIIATIGWLTRQFETVHSGIRIERHIVAKEEEIPEDLKIVIFRVMQESFHNISKYSKADRVILSLQRENGTLELTVADNGVGFDPAQLSTRRSDNGGLGLTSMRERVEMSGGVFTVASTVGEGATVRAIWGVGKQV